MTKAPVPDGLLYVPDFLSPAEEAAALAELEALEYRDVVMYGTRALRTVTHFGWDYGYGAWRGVRPTTPAPPFIDTLRRRAARVVGLDPATMEQVLVARYPPGAGIGWHRDAPMFGPVVVGLSFGAPAVMRFRRGKVRAWEKVELVLEPRSLYAIGGEARKEWQHSLPGVEGLRYSITFRTLLRKEGTA